MTSSVSSGGALRAGSGWVGLLVLCTLGTLGNASCVQRTIPEHEGFRGMVLDVSTGVPVTNARVSVSAEDNPKIVPQVVRTDQAGTFLVQPIKYVLEVSAACLFAPCDPAESRLVVQVTAPGYQERALAIQEAQTAPIQLERSGRKE